MMNFKQLVLVCLILAFVACPIVALAQAPPGMPMLISGSISGIPAGHTATLRILNSNTNQYCDVQTTGTFNNAMLPGESGNLVKFYLDGHQCGYTCTFQPGMPVSVSLAFPNGPTPTPSPHVSPTPSCCPTVVPDYSPTDTPWLWDEDTVTPTPTAEPTVVPTAEPTIEPTPTAEPTATPTPTAEPTATPAPASDNTPLLLLGAFGVLAVVAVLGYYLMFRKR